MTNKQKQNLLAYLGYYTADVDGIWGKLSRKAEEDFLREYGLPSGTFEKRLLEVIGSGAGADSFWDEIEYFTREEPGIACPCGRCGGFPAEPVERLMRNADAVRKHFGRAMIPSSTVRCRVHNAELKGSAPNSLHMRGKAMDFAIPGIAAGEIVKFVKTLPEVHECYAIDSSYVHMGVQKYGGGKEDE